MPQGHVAAIEFEPQLLQLVIRELVDQFLPPGQTFKDPRPGKGPYAIHGPVSLSFAQPSRTVPAARNLVGLVVKIRDTSTQQIGEYTVYYDIVSTSGRLELKPYFVDPKPSTPIPHLPAILLELALKMQGPIGWPLPAGLKVPVRTELGGQGRCVFFVTSPALERSFGLTPAANPTVPSQPLYTKLPTRVTGGGQISIRHTETWAMQVDSSVLTQLLEDAVVSQGAFTVAGKQFSIASFRVTRVLHSGIEIDAAFVEGNNTASPIPVRGPIFLGYAVEAYGSRRPTIRLTVNASQLTVAGLSIDTLRGIAIGLSFLIPPLLVFTIGALPGLLEAWIVRPLNRTLSRSLNSQTEGAKQRLLREAVNLLPDKGNLRKLLTEQNPVRLDISPSALTMGLWNPEIAQSGTTKYAVKIPVATTSIRPKNIMVGWHVPDDIFAPPANATGSGVVLDSLLPERGFVGGLATPVEAVLMPGPSLPPTPSPVPGVLPFEHFGGRSSKVRITVEGKGLDGVSAVKVRRGTAIPLTIVSQSATELELEWDVRGVGVGAWDLELTWSGTLSDGSTLTDHVSVDEQAMHTFLAAPKVRHNWTPHRMRPGEVVDFVNGVRAKLEDLDALRELLNSPMPLDEVEVELPMGPVAPEALAASLDVVTEHGAMVLDMGDSGRLRVRPAESLADDVPSTAAVAAMRHELPTDPTP